MGAADRFAGWGRRRQDAHKDKPDDDNDSVARRPQESEGEAPPRVVPEQFVTGLEPPEQHGQRHHGKAKHRILPRGLGNLAADVGDGVEPLATDPDDPEDVPKLGSGKCESDMAVGASTASTNAKAMQHRTQKNYKKMGPRQEPVTAACGSRMSTRREHATCVENKRSAI